MTRPASHAAFRTADSERLPWLSDKPRRRLRSRTVEVTGWIAAAMVLLAGASYWAGMRSAAPHVAQVGPLAPAEVSVSLPEARGTAAPTDDEPAAPPPEEGIEPAPSVAVQPVGTRTARPRPKRTSPARTARAGEKNNTPLGNDPYPLWPANKIEGADGRLVRIGNFRAEAGAHEAWDKILSEYPGMARLEAVVVTGKSLRDGQSFYRLQVGTSSQAHSEVVCKRSDGLGLGCSIVGLIVNENE